MPSKKLSTPEQPGRPKAQSVSRSARDLSNAQKRLAWDPVGLMAGVDEAGRGPLAGPVVAAAVILDDSKRIRGLADSKVLTPLQRDRLYDAAVMGEFPSSGVSAIPSADLPSRTATQLTTDLWNLGYAGALSWAYNDSAFPWNPTNVKAFANLHPCEVAY